MHGICSRLPRGQHEETRAGLVVDHRAAGHDRRCAQGGTVSGSKSGREVLAGLARGFGGAVLFALPLLMTMEMWGLGVYLGPSRILVLMAGFFFILIGVAHYIGFGDTASVGHAVLHAITAYGVAIISSGVMLGILGVLKPGMGWHELVGKTAIQAGPGALGALLAESHFGASNGKDERRADVTY